MNIEHGGFVPQEANREPKNPLEGVTDEEIDTALGIIDTVPHDEKDNENLLSGEVSPTDFVAGKLRAIRTSVEGRAFGKRMEQAVRDRAAKMKLPDAEAGVWQNIAEEVGRWLNGQLAAVKAERADMNWVLKEGLSLQLERKLNALMGIEAAAARREKNMAENRGKYGQEATQ